jgi:hypothetical protein
MALKKIMKRLEASLKAESEIHPKTMLGVWFHNFKMRNIECRINDVKKELDNRKTKNNGSTKNT